MIEQIVARTLIDNLALDDTETYKLFAREKHAIFQFESTDADILRRYQPPASKTSPAQRALPSGPSRAHDRRFHQPQTREPKSASNSQLKDILEKPTAILYRTGVQIANLLAIFTREADILRRAMERRRRKRWRAARQVHGGCAANKIRRKKPSAS